MDIEKFMVATKTQMAFHTDPNLLTFIFDLQDGGKFAVAVRCRDAEPHLLLPHLNALGEAFQGLMPSGAADFGTRTN